MITNEQSKEIYNRIEYDLLVSGHIALADVSNPIIKSQTVADKFNKLLSDVHQQSKQEQSTVRLLKTMPPQPVEITELSAPSVVAARPLSQSVQVGPIEILDSQKTCSM